jgi:hypothetical protein
VLVAVEDVKCEDVDDASRLYFPGCCVEAVRSHCMSPDRSLEHRRASKSSILPSAAGPEMGKFIDETSLSSD